VIRQDRRSTTLDYSSLSSRPFGSVQCRSSRSHRGASSSQCAPDRSSSGRWNDKRNDHHGSSCRRPRPVQPGADDLEWLPGCLPGRPSTLPAANDRTQRGRDGPAARRRRAPACSPSSWPLGRLRSADARERRWDPARRDGPVPVRRAVGAIRANWRLLAPIIVAAIVGVLFLVKLKIDDWIDEGSRDQASEGLSPVTSSARCTASQSSPSSCSAYISGSTVACRHRRTSSLS
jgi:hypothetical protein